MFNFVITGMNWTWGYIPPQLFCTFFSGFENLITSVILRHLEAELSISGRNP
jgi:hypothetical protein